MAEHGSLTEKVLAYADTVVQWVPTVQGSSDWAPLAEFIAIDEFERIGTFMEVLDWPQYTEMLSAWAAKVDSFESVVRRVVEVDNLVYYETEERHHIGDNTMVLNSMTVFDFNDDGKICHLDVFMQKAP